MSGFLICSFFSSCSFPSRGKFLGKVNAFRVWPPGCTFAEIFSQDRSYELCTFEWVRIDSFVTKVTAIENRFSAASKGDLGPPIRWVLGMFHGV